VPNHGVSFCLLGASTVYRSGRGIDVILVLPGMGEDRQRQGTRMMRSAAGAPADG
jgi:hypothetical protein